MMLSILSCVCWQSVYLLWRNVYLGLLPIFGLDRLSVCFFDIVLHELLVNFGCIFNVFVERKVISMSYSSASLKVLSY